MGEEEKLVRDQKGGNKPVFGINSHPQNFAINCQLSTLNCQLSTVNSQLIRRVAFFNYLI
jgi:hypothetical protein